MVMGMDEAVEGCGAADGGATRRRRRVSASVIED